MSVVILGAVSLTVPVVAELAVPTPSGLSVKPVEAVATEDAAGAAAVVEPPNGRKRSNKIYESLIQ